MVMGRSSVIRASRTSVHAPRTTFSLTTGYASWPSFAIIPLASMRRIFYLAYACSIAAWAQQGLPDAVFDHIPFDQWLKDSGDAHLKWSAVALPSRLSVYQRLGVVLAVRIDGSEFVKRTGTGEVVVFLEVRDRQDRVFRTHQVLRFDQV